MVQAQPLIKERGAGSFANEMRAKGKVGPYSEEKGRGHDHPHYTLMGKEDDHGHTPILRKGRADFFSW